MWYNNRIIPKQTEAIPIPTITLPFSSPPRLLIVAGHFGAGKTNVSLNFAHALHDAGRTVTLIDLDIVNPYFRAADAEAELREAGIAFINPPYANSNVDIPVLGAEIQRVFPLVERDSNATVIFDVGGDNGAVALGRYHAEFTRLGYTMLCVENAYRPLTDSPEAMLENLREVEMYSRLDCNAIINNSNLGSETTPADLADALPMMQAFARLAELPLACTTVCAPIAPTDPALADLDTPLWPIRDRIRRMF